MLRLKEIIVALCFCASACASALPSESSPQLPDSSAASATISDVSSFVFATKDGQQLHLDRILPDAARFPGRRPAIIHSTGGGWETADRRDRATLEYLHPFASLGYVVVSIDYRLGVKEAKKAGPIAPTKMRETYLRAIRWGVEDLYDATDFVLKNAEGWGVDPARIVISGSSAGATNSLVAEFNVANQTELARAHLPATFRYAGVISMAGAFWLEDNTPLAWKQKPAPIMFIHGGKDQLVTYNDDAKNSAYGPVYAQRQLASLGYSSWFIDLPDADHTMSFAGMVDYRSEMEAFLTKMVWEKQEISVHTIETGKVNKTFTNLAKLYRRYLPPELLKMLDGAKP